MYRSVLILFFLCLYGSVNSQTLGVEEIVVKANEAYRYFGDDVKSTAQLEILDASGSTITEKELVILRKNSGGLAQKWYAYFKRPADIKRMVFMAWKHEDKDDDRWLYLPALDLVKRISGSDKRSSFAGSHFAYEDVTGRNPNFDVHELTETSETHYSIKSTPKDPSSVEFAYYISKIDKSTFLPTSTILYNENGIAFKAYELLNSETIQGFPTITKFSMTDLLSKESSVVTMENIAYNIGLTDRVFSEASLRRAPRKFLK